MKFHSRSFSFSFLSVLFSLSLASVPSVQAQEGIQKGSPVEADRSPIPVWVNFYSENFFPTSPHSSGTQVAPMMADIYYIYGDLLVRDRFIDKLKGDSRWTGSKSQFKLQSTEIIAQLKYIPGVFFVLDLDAVAGFPVKSADDWKRYRGLPIDYNEAHSPRILFLNEDDELGMVGGGNRRELRDPLKKRTVLDFRLATRFNYEMVQSALIDRRNKLIMGQLSFEHLKNPGSLIELGFVRTAVAGAIFTTYSIGDQEEGKKGIDFVLLPSTFKGTSVEYPSAEALRNAEWVNMAVSMRRGLDREAGMYYAGVYDPKTSKIGWRQIAPDDASIHMDLVWKPMARSAFKNCPSGLNPKK